MALIASAAALLGTQVFGGLTVGSLITGALGAGTALAGGVAARNAAAYQSSVAKINASIAEENANQSIQDAQIQAMDNDAVTAAMIGQQLSIQGASGLDVGSTSSQQVRAASRRLGQIEAKRIRDAGARQAHNFRTQAAGHRAEAKAHGAAGDAAMFGAFLKAGGSLIGAATPTAQGTLGSLASIKSNRVPKATLKSGYEY